MVAYMANNIHLIDTNYLVRLAVEKNSEQSNIVSNFLIKCKTNGENVKVSLVSVFEFLWVLTKVYKWPETEVLTFLENIYLSTMVEFENQDVLLKALSMSQQNSLGLEDNYNIALAKTENRMLHTFDEKMNKVWAIINV
jgi:predicted nucleic-acid-binding protein